MRLPSHTTVVAYLALFAALGTGGAFAISADRNSVKSRHLANDSVQREHIDDKAIGVKQLAAVPNGKMEGGPQSFENDAFTDAPVTYDTLDYGAPKDAFNLARGVFVVPATGTYNVTGQITWENPADKGGRDARLLKVNADGSPGPTLSGGLSSVIDNGGNQIVSTNVRLQQGDVIQLTVTNAGVARQSTFAQMNVTYQSP